MILTHVAVPMQLENTVLSEISQTQTDSIVCFHLREAPGVTFMGAECRIEVTRLGGRELVRDGYRVLVRKDEKVLPKI